MADEPTTTIAGEGAGDAAPPAPAASDAAPAVETPEKKPDGGAAPEAAAPAGDKTLAAGGEVEPVQAPQDFPDNWRDLVAGDSKKDRKALDRFASPAAMYESWKNANDKLRSGKLLELPGDDATDEDRAAFNKALGVPEKPEEYFDKLALSNGKVLGEDDRANFNSFAEAMHKAGAPPSVVNAAVDWQLQMQEAVVEARAEADAEYRAESENVLRREMGGDFKRFTNAIGTLFTDAPQVMDILLNARTPDGHKLGDTPELIRWLGSTALDMNPTVEMNAPDGDNAKALNDRLGELQKLSANDKSEYWEGPRAKELQAEYARLLDVRNRSRNRAA